MPKVSLFAVLILLATTSGYGGSAHGQFITRWVNSNGVITFSTSSPPPGVAYEAVPMPERGGRGKAEKAVPATQAEHAKAAPPQETKATDPAKDAAKPAGDAQLTIKEQATTALGETQWLLAGKVANDGGAAANSVGIRISVFEDGQGNPCLDDRGAVSPSTIKPGETATFELTYDSPCFFGSPRIDIVAEWQK